jgi:hypothetical protein
MVALRRFPLGILASQLVLGIVSPDEFLGQ